MMFTFVQFSEYLMKEIQYTIENTCAKEKMIR